MDRAASPRLDDETVYGRTDAGQREAVFGLDGLDEDPCMGRSERSRLIVARNPRPVSARISPTPTSPLVLRADQWLPIEGGYRLRDRIPSARFQATAGAGHLMQEDAPEAIVGAVLTFLAEIAAS
jgi:pimeloyl-ACP methyl ester carboxylesterase